MRKVENISRSILGHEQQATPFSIILWNHMVLDPFPVFFLFLSLFLVGCSTLSNTSNSPSQQSEIIIGCDGQSYLLPAESPYILPFAAGETFKTGLTNCSSSFHSAGRPDQYAFDFDTPIGTPFIAARSGTVFEVVEDAPSNGGGVGNYVSIDHLDGTYGLYYHSPQDGIDVEVGDEVKQGDVLGITGQSGLAGYPHLHFIVVRGSPKFPYEGVAISFSNASPADVPLKDYTAYTANPP